MEGHRRGGQSGAMYILTILGLKHERRELGAKECGWMNLMIKKDDCTIIASIVRKIFFSVLHDILLKFQFKGKWQMDTIKPCVHNVNEETQYPQQQQWWGCKQMK